MRRYQPAAPPATPAVPLARICAHSVRTSCACHVRGAGAGRTICAGKYECVGGHIYEGMRWRCIEEAAGGRRVEAAARTRAGKECTYHPDLPQLSPNRGYLRRHTGNTCLIQHGNDRRRETRHAEQPAVMGCACGGSGWQLRDARMAGGRARSVRACGVSISNMLQGPWSAHLCCHC